MSPIRRDPGEFDSGVRFKTATASRRVADPQFKFLSFDNPQSEHLLAGLSAARVTSKALLNAELDGRRLVQGPVFLRNTAQHILESITQLADDDAFWNQMEESERALGRAAPQDIIAVEEILESDLAGLLDLMGYSPPPPNLTIATDLQLAFTAAMAEPDLARRAARTKDARQAAFFFVYHLRQLVEETKDVALESRDGQHLGRRLLAAGRTGARALGPAAIAAAAGGLLFPQDQAMGALAVSLGATEGAKELVQQAIELGSVALFASTVTGQAVVTDPEAQFQAASNSFIDAGMQIADLLDGEPEQIPVPILRAYMIEAMRWFFELERARWRLPDSTRARPSRQKTMALFQGLADFRDFLDSGGSRRDLRKILKRLDVAIRKVEKFSHHR